LLINHLFRFFFSKALIQLSKLCWSLLSTKTPEILSTNSGVAQSLYPNTGTPKSNASAVPIPKLSLVKLISHLAFFIISILS
jgi:hypothetical protein